MGDRFKLTVGRARNNGWWLAFLCGGVVFHVPGTYDRRDHVRTFIVGWGWDDELPIRFLPGLVSSFVRDDQRVDAKVWLSWLGFAAGTHMVIPFDQLTEVNRA